jgi:hypothetical protein
MAKPKKLAEAASAADAQADGIATTVPTKWTPDSAVDPSVCLVDLVGAMFPGQTLVKCRAIGRDPENPERILAESYYPEGAIQPVYGLPFRVGKYARVKDDKGRATETFRGGSAPLTGYVPASLWNDARFEELTEADADGEP